MEIVGCDEAAQMKHVEQREFGTLLLRWAIVWFGIAVVAALFSTRVRLLGAALGSAYMSAAVLLYQALLRGDTRQSALRKKLLLLGILAKLPVLGALLYLLSLSGRAELLSFLFGMTCLFPAAWQALRCKTGPKHCS